MKTGNKERFEYKCFFLKLWIKSVMRKNYREFLLKIITDRGSLYIKFRVIRTVECLFILKFVYDIIHTNEYLGWVRDVTQYM